MNNESPFLNEFNKTKWLMFYEIEPLSDKFQQMAFTEEQTKKIGNFVSELLGFDPNNPEKGFEITTDDEVEINVPNARFFYPAEFIKKDI